MIRKCLVCGLEFTTCNYHIIRNHGKFCSQKCFGIFKKQVKRIYKPCGICNKIIMTYKNNENKFCSNKCYGISRRGKKLPKFTQQHIEKMRKSNIGKHIGENNKNWKGGKCYDGLGYVSIYSPNHPYKTKQNRVYEHRLIMEKHIKRFLSKEEQVHHINNIKDDNRIENLILFKNAAEHIKFHSIS